MAISYTRTSGKDIAELVDAIENVVNGHPSSHVAVSCMIVAILSQKQDITKEVLQEAVKGVSDWLSMYLTETSPTIN